MKKIIFTMSLMIGSLQANSIVFADTLDIRDILSPINKPSYPGTEIY